MAGLKERIADFGEDLITIEASIRQDDEVLAYSKVEFEGDTLNWLAEHPNQHQIVALQSTQLRVSGQCRGAMIGLTKALLTAIN